MTVCFGMVFTIYPVALAKAQDNIKQREIVSVSAALILFFGFGACLGPVAASTIMSMVGPFGLYYFMAGCGVTLGSVALATRRRMAGSFEVEDQVPYIPIHGTSPVANILQQHGREGIESKAEVVVERKLEGDV
jgi:hypothetical protein